MQGTSLLLPRRLPLARPAGTLRSVAEAAVC